MNEMAAQRRIAMRTSCFEEPVAVHLGHLDVGEHHVDAIDFAFEHGKPEACILGFEDGMALVAERHGEHRPVQRIVVDHQHGRCFVPVMGPSLACAPMFVQLVAPGTTECTRTGRGVTPHRAIEVWRSSGRTCPHWRCRHRARPRHASR